MRSTANGKPRQVWGRSRRLQREANEIFRRLRRDTPTLYANNGSGLCEDRTSPADRPTTMVGWASRHRPRFSRLQDLFLVNGHVYQESAVKSEAGYRQRKCVSQPGEALRDVTEQLGPP